MQSEKCKTINAKSSSEKLSRNDHLSERLLNFAASIIKSAAMFNKGEAGCHIFKQLMRSSTSSGANYEEARGAESLADFIHKLQIVLKELRESIYWLRLTNRAELIPNQNLDHLAQEAGELANIIAKSVVTARKRVKCA